MVWETLSFDFCTPFFTEDFQVLPTHSYFFDLSGFEHRELFAQESSPWARFCY